jgi:hypothetical protein
VAVTDGSYNFTLTIWDAVSGGNCLWSARGTCGTPTVKSVAVAKGIFSTYLGEAGDNTLSLDFNSNYFLEITVGADTAMAPRKKITAAGFAINAGKLNGQSASYYLDTSATEQTKTGGLNVSGEVGVGTTDPNRNLEVYGGDSAIGYARVTGGEGYDSVLELYADQGDDSADKFDLISTIGNLLQVRNNASALLTIKSGGNVGIGTTDPTAVLHLKAGTATAGTAPLKFTSGTALGTPEDGAVEYDTSHLYFTIGSTRYQLDQQSGGSGANTALSNLASVAINTSLLPGTNDSIDLGSTDYRWANLYLGGETLHLGASLTDEATISYDSNNLLNFSTDSTINGDIAFFSDDLYLDKSTARIGIGTTAPGAALDVLLAGEQLRLSYSDTYYTKFTTGNDSKLTVETSASTQSMIKVGKGEAQDSGISFDGNTNDYYAGMDDTTDKFMIGLGVAIGTTPYVTLESGGDLGIGTTDPTAQLHTTGTVRFANFGAGTLSTDSSGNVSVSSDERLKNITGSFNRGLEDILKINPIVYRWNDLSGMEMENEYAGFSAQNVKANIPEAVGMDARGYLTLSDRAILAAVVNGVKEQQLMIAGISQSQMLMANQIQNSDNQTAGLINRMAELQVQIDDLRAAYISPDSASPERLVKWSEMQAEITLAFEQIQAENDPTLNKILEMQNRLNRLEKKIIAADLEEVAPEEIVFQDFSEQTSAISFSLAETEFSDGAFSGNYLVPEIYNEIRVVKINGLNLDDYNVSDGYLSFQIFLEDGDNLSDFVTELGNEMDAQEIQWNLEEHPYLASGWNEVNLKFSEGTKTGEINWSNLNYFRVYFNFQSNNQVRLKDIKLVVAKKTATVLAASENVSETVLVLDSPEENVAADIANQQDLVNSLNDNPDNSKLYLAQMENNLAETNLLKSILGLDRVANASDVDILGRLSAESTESGQMLIKVNEEAKRTIGEAVIFSVKKDENQDGLDDDTGSDGKKVFVPTLLVNPKSKIFVTSQKATDQNLAVTSKVPGSGFWVEVKNSLNADLDFDWWMVEETGILEP